MWGTVTSALALSAIACGAAAGGVAGYLIFRCARNDERTVLPLHWRPWMAAATGLLCGLLVWRLGLSWELPAFLLLPVFGVLLAAIDLRTKLLPNRLLLPFTGLVLVLLAAASGLGGGWASLLGAVVGGSVMFLLYLAMALVTPGGIGMGDVKLAGVLGFYGGYAGAVPWLVTVLGGFVVGGVAGVLLLILGGHSRKSHFPFGPAMLVGAMAAALGWS